MYDMLEDLNTLQLGHAGEGVEIRHVRRPFVNDPLLQLGHAGEGVEIRLSTCQTLVCSTSFNWATPVKAWR